MLRKRHGDHLGDVKCKERARDVLSWLGMSTQIEDVLLKCGICNLSKRAM